MTEEAKKISLSGTPSPSKLEEGVSKLGGRVQVEEVREVKEKLSPMNALQVANPQEVNGRSDCVIIIRVSEDKPSDITIEGRPKPRYITRAKRDLTRAWGNWKRAEIKRQDAAKRFSEQVLENKGSEGGGDVQK